MHRTLSLGLLALVTTSAAVGQGATPYRAAPELRPAAVLSANSAVARTLETPVGRRIWAAAPAHLPAVELGPETPGDDGAPTIAAMGDEVVIVGARWRGRTAGLWTQRWRDGRWQSARKLQARGPLNHHPAIASDGKALWASWLTEAPDGTRALAASRIRGGRLENEALLPHVGTGPGAPAIMLDTRGRPVVAWSAFDGNDTEIWLSRLVEGAWTTPTQLTDNDVPDELPQLAPGRAGRVLASWSQFGAHGYLPHASVETRTGFSVPTRLDARATGFTQALGGDDEIVVWQGIETDGRVYRMAAREGQHWSAATDLGFTGESRIRASRSGQRVLVATDLSNHSVARIERDGRGVATLDLDLPERPVARVSIDGLPGIPGTYRAFGDSITEGIIRFDGVVTPSEGYPGPLTEFLNSFLGRRKIAIENQGVGGEITVEGMGRLSGLNNTAPRLYTFIMEGINDATQAINENTVAANLRNMVQGTHATDGLAIVSTITPRTQGNFNGGSNPLIRTYNDLIVPMARSEGALLVDQWSAFLKKAHLYSDFLHPNSAGYHHMAVTWFRGLQPILAALLLEMDNDNAAARTDVRRGLPRGEVIH